MGIEVAWVGEDLEPKQQVFDPRMHLTKLALGRWRELPESVCLRFVDPFGDAVFNQAQVPHLIRELKGEVATERDLEVRNHLEKVVRLVERSVDQAHTYVKFIGD